MWAGLHIGAERLRVGLFDFDRCVNGAAAGLKCEEIQYVDCFHEYVAKSNERATTNWRRSS